MGGEDGGGGRPKKFSSRQGKGTLRKLKGRGEGMRKKKTLVSRRRIKWGGGTPKTNRYTVTSGSRNFLMDRGGKRG